MNIKETFGHISKTKLAQKIISLGIDGDLI